MSAAQVAGTPEPSCDLSKLQKGGYLPPGYLEKKLGALRETDEYRLKVMTLVDKIRNARPDLAAHLKTEKHGIRILTDHEAEEYADVCVRQSVGRISRVSGRRSSIDRLKFDDTTRRTAEHRDTSYASLVLSARKALRRMKP